MKNFIFEINRVLWTKKKFLSFLMMAVFSASLFAATYTVAGDNTTVFGKAWTPAETANDMTLVDGLYTFAKTDVTLPAGSIAFKVCQDHAWTNSWPAQNYSLSIPASGKYDITITFNESTKDVNAKADKKEDVVVLPSIAMHGNFLGSWADTENFTEVEGNETAVLTLNLAAGDYEFGMRIGGSGNWTSNGAAFTRENPSAVVESGQGNLTLAADKEGTYTFTWTFATNTLAITFPEAGDDPQPAEMTAIYDWAGEVGTTFFGTTGVEISTVKIHTNTDAVPAIKFGSSYVNADGKWVAIKPAKGGFKAGDVLSVSVVFNNADDTKYAQIDLRAANGDTRIWLSDSASTINGRTQAGEPIVQTYTLEADQDSLFLGRYGNTAMFVTLLKVERAAGGETPEDPAKFYITGDAATVGESLAWNPAAIKSTEDAYTLSLAAGNYKLKVTVDGTWATAKGFDDLTLENKQGLSNDNDGNICFTLAEAGDVVVTYTAEAFTVTGNFYVAPVEVKYYMKHNFEGGEEWTWKEMSLMPAEESGDDVTYILENVIFRGSGVNINTKAEDEGAMWVPAENIVAYDGNLNPATLGAGDKVVFMFVPELVSVHEYKYGLSAIIVEKADPIVPETPKYYMKHNFEGGEEWTWKEMSLMPAEESGDDVTYVLENVIFRGSGVNINTKAEDEGAMWVPAENIVAYDGNLNPATLGAGDKVVFMFVPELVSVHEYKYGLSAIIIEKADPIVPETPKYYMKNNWGAGADWTWKAMTQDGETYKLESVIFGGNGVNYNTAESDEGATWVPADQILGDKIAAKDTVTFVLDPVAKTVTATLVSAGGGTPEPPTPGTVYYMKNNWGAGADWTWKAMTQDGETYKLESVIFGGNGVNYNTAESDEGATWVPADQILGDKIAAKDTVTFVLDPVAKTVTATLVSAGGGTPEPPTPEEHTYTVAGSSTDLFDTAWAPTNEANDMVLVEGLYTWEKTDLTLAAGSIEFKVCEDHAWTNSWPAQNCNLTIPEAGIYTITITFNAESKEVNAVATKTGSAVVIPTVAMHGNFLGSWADTENFTVAEDNASASLTLTIAAGNYEFGMRIGGAGNWTANGAEFSRQNPSAVVVAGQGNLKLAADEAGEYTFTWTFATNTLAITFPTPTGFEETVAAEKATKILRNGQIFILKGDKIYNVMGGTIK